MPIKLINAIDQIDEAAWNRLVDPGNPFLSHGFLHALEASGSTGRRTGWQPLHVLDEQDGSVRGAVPLYVKSNSYGEYVFDHGWANAFERAGGRYYPKLQVSVPFTPVPGPRLLVENAPDPDAERDRLISALTAAAEKTGVSSVHVTFANPADIAAFERAGWLIRQGVQYHWHNRGYRDFADFLDRMKSSRRKTIRKERQAVADQGITLEALSGPDLKPFHWDIFWPFYLSTVDKRWGSAYLTRAFFKRLGEVMADRVVLIMAMRAGKPVGAALNLLGADTLYGRIWGCLEEYRFLHFEACYYAAIDFAIARGLAHVEAGAQGTHKLQRGYEPVATWSAHLIAHDGLREAVARYLVEERAAVRDDMTGLRELLPYRCTDAG